MDSHKSSIFFLFRVRAMGAELSGAESCRSLDPDSPLHSVSGMQLASHVQQEADAPKKNWKCPLDPLHYVAGQVNFPIESLWRVLQLGQSCPFGTANLVGMDGTPVATRVCAHDPGDGAVRDHEDPCIGLKVDVCIPRSTRCSLCAAYLPVGAEVWRCFPASPACSQWCK